MVEKRTEVLMAHSDDAERIKKQLKKWDIVPEKTDTGFAFGMQSDNVFHIVELDIVEDLSDDEKMLGFLRIPIVASFEEIQERVLGKVVFDWK